MMTISDLEDFIERYGPAGVGLLTEDTEVLHYTETDEHPATVSMETRDGKWYAVIR